jgi:ABC-type hemin transport system ATPase subunit
VSEGRIAAAGAKRDILTSERLSALFNAPIALEEDDGYYYGRPASVQSQPGRASARQATADRDET